MDGGFWRKKSGVGEVKCERRNGVNETETEVGEWRLRGGEGSNRCRERASVRKRLKILAWRFEKVM